MAEPTRTNELLATVASGDVALGVLDNTFSPMLVEFYADSASISSGWTSNTAGRVRTTGRR